MSSKVLTTHLISKRVTVADLTTAGVSQSFDFSDAIPKKALVVAAWPRLDVVFAGGGASSAVVDVGDGTDVDGYVDNEDMFTGAALGQRTTPATAPALLDGNPVDIGATARTPTVAITSDVNVDTLTTGELSVFILYHRIPGGANV